MPIVNYWKSWAVSTTGFFMRNLLGGVWINSAILDVPMYYHARVNEIRRIARNAGETQDVLEGLDVLIDAGKSVKLPSAVSAVAGPRTVNIDEPMDLEIAKILMEKNPREYIKKVDEKEKS